MGHQSPSKRVALDSLFIGLLTLASFYFFYLRPGLLIGHDLLYEIVRLTEFKQAVATQFYPRLAPDLYYGYGSPIFIFYPPLFLWVTSLVDFAINNFNYSVKLVVIALGIIGSIFCYSFLRLFSHNRAAFLGTVFYLLAPYKFADIYSRNAFAEYTAFCLLPPVFYFLALHFLVALKDSAKCQTGLFISLFLLSLSHTISLLLVLPFVAATAVYLHWLKARSKPRDLKAKKSGRLQVLDKKVPLVSPSPAINRLLSALAIILLALAGASFYLLPAFSYRDLVRMEELLADKFYFGQNFVNLSELFFDRSSFFYQSPLPLIALVWGLYYPFRRPWKVAGSPLGLLGLGFSVAALLMMFPASFFAWNLIPLLPYVQFPWRFLLLFSFCTSWVVAFIADQCPPEREIWCYAAIATSVLLLGTLHHSQYSHSRTFDAVVSITPEKILYENLGATVGDEYLPRAAESPLPGLSEREKAIEAQRAGKHPPSSIRYRKCQFFPEKSRVEFVLNNFPYWILSVDGERRPNSGSAPTLQIEVPAGNHCIEARLGYLNLQVVGLLVSGCSIALFGAAMALRRRHKIILPNKPGAPDRS